MLLAVFFIPYKISCGAEYIDSVKFEEVKLDSSVIWSGREWLTNIYPPQVSRDAIEFTNINGTEEVKSELKNSEYTYLWTGTDYLVYQSNADYRMFDKQKYLYRISDDFEHIINKYEVPNWISNMVLVDNRFFISTYNVYPKLSGERVLGISNSEYEVYYSDDCVNWKKLNYDELNSYYYKYLYLNDIADKLLINNYIYKNGNLSKVVYENSLGSYRYKVGQYLCKIDNSNVIKNEDNVVLSFSKDGIYWRNLVIDQRMDTIQNVSVVGNNIIINDSKNIYMCEKNVVFEQLDELFGLDQVYVKFNGQYLGFENPPVIEDDSTLVPMRFLFEQMGADVGWNGATRTATATLEDTAVTFSIDNTQATVNKAPAKMAVPARLIDDKTMVPLRFLSEELGFTVTWDADTRTAIIE